MPPPAVPFQFADLSKTGTYSPITLMMTRFGALSVELGVVHLLPRAEVQLPLGHRHDHFVVHQQALQVRIAVGLTGAVVPVVFAERRQLFQPLVDIRHQAVLRVVYPYAGGDVHGRDQNHPFRDPALAQGRFHFRRNVDILPVFLCRNVRYSVWNFIARSYARGIGTAAGHILIVDDEPVAPHDELYLGSLGHSVATLSSTARGPLWNPPPRLLLVVLDATMPGSAWRISPFARSKPARRCPSSRSAVILWI